MITRRPKSRLSSRALRCGIALLTVLGALALPTACRDDRHQINQHQRALDSEKD